MKLTKTCLFLSAMTAMLIGLGGTALAQGAPPTNATENILVTASVTKSCSIQTLPVSFGEYLPLSGNAKTANGQVTITCTKDAGTSIELSLGANSNRTMKSGSNYLPYELHKNSLAGAIWATGSDALVSGPAPDLTPRDYIIYGRIPPSQPAPEGSYSDTVVATVNF